MAKASKVGSRYNEKAVPLSSSPALVGGLVAMSAHGGSSVARTATPHRTCGSGHPLKKFGAFLIRIVPRDYVAPGACSMGPA
jgi:hypothetical protein